MVRRVEWAAAGVTALAAATSSVPALAQDRRDEKIVPTSS
jgi:hypothetical protein